MKIVEIASADNQKLKFIRGLAGGKKQDSNENVVLIEGAKLIEEALSKNVDLIDVVASKSYIEDGFSKTKWTDELKTIIVVSDRIFESLYTTDTSCGIIAVANIKHYDLKEVVTCGLQTKLLLLADNIQDPGNLGTIIRTAYAFQTAGIILSKGCADCYSPKVVRSTMGAIFSLPVASGVDLKLAISELKKNNFVVIALDNKSDKLFCKEVSEKPKAYILGNEGHGISPDIANLVDQAVSIPINPDCESLNVAVTAGIILAQEKLKNI